MHHALPIASAMLFPLFAATAQGAEVERYRMEKSESGFVRIDTQTGEMSICEERTGQLVCRLAADERAAFQGDVDRLQDSVKSLEERVSKLENSYAARLESSLPSEEDFDKTMTYMERFFRGFVGIVKELQDEEPGSKTSAPGQQKT